MMATVTIGLTREQIALLTASKTLQNTQARIEDRRDRRPYLSDHARAALTRAAALLSLAAHDLREVAGMEVE